ncbi:MAG: hypothetical protein WCI19_16030 [Betaproteobacteria bacterium]
MYPLLRKMIAHPALAIGSTLLWGILELIALQRSHRGTPRRLG